MDVSAPHCIVEIENRRFDSWRGEDLIASSVELNTDKTGEGCVELYDPDFKIVDNFLSGGVKALQARFWFGWKKDVGNSLFVGNLARVEWQDNVTTFRFHDFSSKMKQQKKTRYFKKKSDIQILKQLAKDNDLEFSLKGKIEDGQPIDSLMQAGKTDWEMALKIAERAGLRLYVRGNVLFAIEAGTTKLEKSAAALGLAKDFTLLRGFNLSYKLPENKKGRSKQTEVRGRGKNGRQLTGKNVAGTTGTENLIVREDLPQPSIAMATRRAGGKSKRQREYAFEHQLQTLPTFEKIIELRNTVTLAGMGKFWSGDYIVTDIRYSFRLGQLTSELTVGRDVLK